MGDTSVCDPEELVENGERGDTIECPRCRVMMGVAESELTLAATTDSLGHWLQV